MIKLDREYSDYTELNDPAYPNGKAKDCSTDESYDGTPILQSLVNDVKGALESVVYQAEGNLNGVSGNPDNIAASDFLNALKKLISTPDNKHAALRGTDAHGATTTATAGQLMSRDSNGRSQVAAPSADADISTKKYVDDGVTAAKNLANATGTLAVANGGTGATSAADARTNLGVPPTSHASSGTSYGVSSATNYGHAKASSTTPKANGTASAGSETSSFARGDHVHPVQTTVSGNAGSATKLVTARKLKVALGSTTDKTFNGTADVTDIPVNGTLPVANGGTGATSAADARTNLDVSPTSHASSDTTYGVASATDYGHAKASSTTPKANGTASAGSETSSFARGDHVHPVQTTVSGNAGSATKLVTARKLKVALGSTTDKTFNGTADVTDIPVGGTLPVANGGTGNTSVDSAPTANSTKMCTSGGIQSAISTAESNAKNLANATGTLAIAHGGTGATTAAGVRNALGLGNTTGALPVANGGTGATDAAAARTNLGLGNVRNEAYSVPVGFTYFQLPGEKAPSELFPNTYTWLDITAHFEGLFFRAAGGNAKAFDTCNYEVQTTNATTVTLKKTPTGLAVGDTVICYNTGDESKTKTRKIKAISSSTITFEDSISSANYTNVLITQGDLNKSHNHSYTDPGHEHGIYVGGTRVEYKGACAMPGAGSSLGYWGSGDTTNTRAYSSTTRITIDLNGGTESRPQNTSIKIWKRTA